MTLTLSSPAFDHNGKIPPKYTCDDRNVSPPLNWNAVPPGAVSMALIVDDPDAPDPAAPQRTWVHWVLYNIPADAGSLSEAAGGAELPRGTLQGVNDWGKPGYGGPCPPIGNHRYIHKLYALDTTLPDLHQPTKAELEKAMEGHILARAELIGYFQRGA